MPVYGLDHVQVAIPQEEEAKARSFYGALLGLVEIPKPASLAERGGLWYQLGEQQLHIGVQSGFQPALKAHPAFLVHDLDGLVASLRQAGYEILTDRPLEGYKRFFTKDPFGNRVELMERLG